MIYSLNPSFLQDCWETGIKSTWNDTVGTHEFFFSFLHGSRQGQSQRKNPGCQTLETVLSLLPSKLMFPIFLWSGPPPPARAPLSCCFQVFFLFLDLFDSLSSMPAPRETLGWFLEHTFSLDPRPWAHTHCISQISSVSVLQFQDQARWLWGWLRVRLEPEQEEESQL